jgi:hypothetical protein
MYPWKTVGMLNPSSTSLATYALLVGDCRRMDSSRPVLMTCCSTWYSSNTFEELKLPIKGPMEDAGVIKLYVPSPTPCLYVAPVENITGRVPLFPLFLAGNSTPTVPHCYSKRKDTGFPMGCADSAAVDGRARQAWQCI